MVDFIQNLFLKIFNNNAYLATFFIAMVPIIELKGAVAFGMSGQIFGANALSPFMAWIISSLGSWVPALFLAWAFKPIVTWLKNSKTFNKVSTKIENKYKKDAVKIQNNNKNKVNLFFKKCLGLIAFVGIPLPLTGAYTGSVIGVYLGIGYLLNIMCVLIGNLLAGAIVVLLCTVFKGYELLVFGVFCLIVIMAIVYKIIKSFWLKKRQLNMQK